MANPMTTEELAEHLKLIYRKRIFPCEFADDETCGEAIDCDICTINRFEAGIRYDEVKHTVKMVVDGLRRAIETDKENIKNGVVNDILEVEKYTAALNKIAEA